MDPTKPILDLYGDNYRTRSNNNNYHNNNYQNKRSQKRTTGGGFADLSYTQLKEKYQELYQSYNDKVERLGQTQYELAHYKSQNQKLKEQIYSLNQKNDHLNASILNKNVELEDAYRKLQDQLKKGNRNKRNQETIDRLEDGLRQAINVNFSHLKEASLAQLKRCMPKS